MHNSGEAIGNDAENQEVSNSSDILSEVPSFDKEAAEKNVEAAKQQIEQEDKAIAQEQLEDQETIHQVEPKQKSDEELYARMKEIYHRSLEHGHPKKPTPEELAEIEDIRSQLFANINDADTANQFIDNNLSWSIKHPKELADKGGDPLKILEVAASHGFAQPELGNELLGMGYSLREMVDRIDNDHMGDWFSYFMDKGIDPSILKDKLGKSDYKWELRQYKKFN